MQMQSPFFALRVMKLYRFACFQLADERAVSRGHADGEESTRTTCSPARPACLLAKATRASALLFARLLIDQDGDFSSLGSLTPSKPRYRGGNDQDD